MSTSTRRTAITFWVVAVVTLLVAGISLFLGVSDISITAVFTDPAKRDIFFLSRVPRTLALFLAGSGLAVAGLIMQHLTRNRFVSPTTAGTIDAAGLGILATMILMPGIPVLGKVGVAIVFATVGSFLFIALIRTIQFKDVIFVPLMGLLLGGVFAAISEFFAFRYNMVQQLTVWMNGDFSGIIQGRYETLYLAAAGAIMAYLFANRFTVAGMGRDFATNVGVNYQLILSTGLVIASAVTAIVVVTVGAIPFLGLIVPNIVTLILGDNLRRVLPITAIAGAGFVMLCDVIGRSVIYPYEIAVGTIVSIVGSVVFIVLVMRRNRYGNA